MLAGLSILLAKLALSTLSRAAPPFSRSVTVDETGELVVTYKDADSGVVVETVYDASNKVERFVELSPGGAVAETRTFHDATFVRETFDPVHTLETVRPSRERPGYDEAESTEWVDGKARTVRVLVPHKEATSCEAVPAPTDVSRARQLLGSVRAIRLKIEKESEHYVFFTDNIVVAKRCGEEPGPYKGGIKQLGAEMQDALMTGLQCLREHGRKNGKLTAEALRIAGLLDRQSKPLRIYCGPPGTQTAVLKGGGRATVASDEFARSLVSSETDEAPAIQVNTEMSSKPAEQAYERHGKWETRRFDAPRERAGMLFHELLHQLGYQHTEGMVDLPYLAQYCCFADENKAPMSVMSMSDMKKDSCALMEQTGKVRVDDFKYQGEFMTVMANGLRAEQGFASALVSSQRTGRPMKIDASTTIYPFDGRILTSVAYRYKHSAVAGPKSTDLLAAIYYNAGMKNLGAETKVAHENYEKGYIEGYSVGKGKLVESLGTLLSSVVARDKRGVALAVQALKGLRNECAQLDDDEKKDLKTYYTDVVNLYMDRGEQTEFLKSYCSQ